LYSSLIGTGLDPSSDAQSFAAQVHALVPRKTKPKVAKAAPAVANQRFTMLLDDEPEASSSKRKKEKRDKKDKSSRDKEDGGDRVKLSRSSRKKDTEGNWDDEPEPSPPPEEEYVPKRARFESPIGDGEVEGQREETEEERAERERLEDIAERDAFAERMREKDKDRTKKLVTDRTTRGEDGLEAERRALLADDPEARRAVVDDLRLRSRQEYLTKREQQRLDLLKMEIEDEKILFRNQKMSKREEREFEKKKELIKIMEARQRIDDGRDGYMMPDDYITEQGKMDAKKRKNALYQRYEENKPVDGQFVTDVDQWEAHQTDKTNLKTGAMDVEFQEEQYDFVFDESQKIKFDLDSSSAIKGNLTTEEQRVLDQINEAERKRTYTPYL
jgi:pre-mRNA-splicing factor ATP-dependent RNA helicase DHX16